MISMINYSKSIKNKVILSDIDLNFEEGKIYLLTGHNGCGKTMILRAICNLIKPTSGSIKKDKDYSFGAIIENPSFLDNETAFYNLSYLSKIKGIIKKSEIEDALKKVNLFEHKSEKVKTYSLGMKQRLGICQAFMENPDVILLDEPFNALDDENNNIIKELLKKLKTENKIIIIAAHGLENTEMYDCIIKMNSGKIVNT
jgi:ABC-2 type transport system ATP-binding protein